MTLGPARRRDQLLEQLVACLDLTTATVLAADDDALVDEPPVAGTPQPPALVARKVVAEATLLVRASTRIAASDPRVATSLAALVTVVLPRARPDTLPAALCLDGGHALNHAYAHVQLTAAGLTDPAIDRLLDHALSAPRTGGVLSGADELENAWLLALLRGRDLTRDPGAVGRTPLGAPYDALGGSLQDGYELTHAVLQATDLGAWTCPAGRPDQDLAADADALLATALDTDNLDLAAEALWTFPMLRLDRTPAADLATGILSRAHDRHGFLPGPGYDARVAASLTVAERSAYALRTSYHATLVWGLLCAATLAAPPSGCVHTLPPSGAGRRAFGLLGPAELPWQRAAQRLDDVDLDRLASFALTAALRRAHRAGDVAELCRALSLAADDGLASGTAVAQALHVVRRSTLVIPAAEPARPAPV